MGLFNRKQITRPPGAPGRPNTPGGAAPRVGTPTPYQPYLYPVTPNYLYSGTVPVGPLGMAWQGVQKLNAVARVDCRYNYKAFYAEPYTATIINMNNGTARHIGTGLSNAALYQQNTIVFPQQSRQSKQSLGSRILGIARGQNG